MGNLHGSQRCPDAASNNFQSFAFYSASGTGKVKVMRAHAAYSLFLEWKDF
jgi:hypothetical protein